MVNYAYPRPSPKLATGWMLHFPTLDATHALQRVSVASGREQGLH